MDSPAQTNHTLLMDIKYSLNELKQDIAGIKNELLYIKARQHNPPPCLEPPEPDPSAGEPAPGWFWSG
tara:strand:+ start:531 stop:734 length:204 start_codon:yes stop_codon:yes gene_type:complete